MKELICNKDSKMFNKLSLFFEKTNKIDKALTTLIKKEKEKAEATMTFERGQYKRQQRFNIRY